jgi:hypothetical protein
MKDELFRYRCGFCANVSSLRCICGGIVSTLSSLDFQAFYACDSKVTEGQFGVLTKGVERGLEW